MKRNIHENIHRIIWGTIFLFLLFTLYACAGISGGGDVVEALNKPSTDTRGQWTWASGDSKTDQRGVYGTQGVAAATNKPGGRSDAVSWVDSEDNLWLFGGYGYAGERIAQYLNDLWKFDGTGWTWVSGGNTGGEKGVYGARGVAAAANKPGGRSGAVSWVDSQGNLWLFGGWGYADHWYAQLLDDLWKFDGNQWAWVSGECEKDYPGVYGTRGVAESTNHPGARSGAVSWTDAAGNLWLFGGYGYDGYTAEGYLNDLWKFDGTNWTWVSGDNTIYEMGNYGSKGVTAGSNKPGARSEATGWVDSSGNFWLFGGHGNANISWKSSDVYRAPQNSGSGHLNDLWKFDGTNWTWVSGDDVAYYSPPITYEVKDSPPARYGGVGLSDNKGNLWLFGGNANIRFTRMSNDLWKFDVTNWHLIYAAVSHESRQAVYGKRGVAAAANRPGARDGAVGWTDSDGTLWIFGGHRPDGSKNAYFNDLWKFEP